MTLYRYLVTDDVWARQRAEYGYRDVRPCPLLVELVGHPYVDVRASFNSFVPASLLRRSRDAARRALPRRTRRASRPARQGRVRCGLHLPDRRFRQAGHTPRRRGLLGRRDRPAARRRCERSHDGASRVSVATSRSSPSSKRACKLVRDATDSAARRAFHHLETARRFGTPVFAHLARSAFVATESCCGRSRTKGVIGAVESGNFLASIETVLGRMQADGRRVKAGDTQLGRVRRSVRSPPARDLRHHLSLLSLRSGGVPATGRRTRR